MYSHSSWVGVAADADHAHAAVLLPNRSEISRRAGVALRVSSAPAAVDLEGQLAIGAAADDALHVGECLDRLAVDADDHVARLEAGARGRPAGHQLVDPRRGHLHAHKRERQRENDDGQDEVRYRAGRHDGRPRRQRLGLEGAGALVRRHALERRLGGNAGAVLVVEELDVAAERDPGEAPAGAVPVVEAEDLPAEADREGLDLARRTSARPGNGRARG